MKVFIVSEADDTGGVAIAIKRAVERTLVDVEVRTMRGSNNYIDYPADLTWDGPERFHELWAWADVIHTMEKLTNILALVEHPDKPIVLHHHGDEYRGIRSFYQNMAAQHRIPQVASTVDMTIHDSHVTWIPNPIDTRLMAAIRSQYRPSQEPRPLIVGHNPTRRGFKGTDLLVEACDQLGIPLALTEYKPWLASLADRARCDIYFDQLLYGYGLAGAEAMAMGIPVIGGWTDATARAAFTHFVPEMPLDEVRVDRPVASVLQELYHSPDRQRQYRDRGEAFVSEFHNQGKVATAFREVWRQAIDEFSPEDWA